jgi:hypothetical protein
MEQAVQPPIVAAAEDMGGAAPITVPGGPWLLSADFARLGPDLLLTGADGQKQLLTGYFNSETPADLITEGGAVISGDLATKLAGPVAPAQFAQAAPAAAADPIGRVETVEGGVEVTRADGTKITLGHGAPLFSGDVIETAENASVGIVLADDSTLSLAESGRMVMDEVAYDPATETGNATISVVQGVFSFVSGQIAKVDPDAMVLRTPVAQIGIRGTKIAGVAAAEGQENTISLLPDADGFIGEISVSNSAGTIVLNQAGATTSLASAFQAPAKPVIVPIAQIQKQFSKALKSLPAKPAPQQDDAPEENQGEGEEAAAEGEVPPEGEGENLEGEGEELAEGEVPPEGEGENLEGEGEEGEIDAQSPEDSDEDFADGQEGEGGLDGEPGEQLAENGEQGAPEAAFQEAMAGGATVEEAFDAAAQQAMEGMTAEGVSEDQAQQAMDAAKAAYSQAIADGFSPEQALALAAEAAGAEVPDTLADGFNTDPTGEGATEELASNVDGNPENTETGSETGGDGGSDPSNNEQPAEDGSGEPTGDGEPTGTDGGDYQPYSGGQVDYSINTSFNLNSGPEPTYDYYQSSYEFESQTIINLSNDDPNSTEPNTTTAFTEILTATTGNDALAGGDGNTQFSMVQGSTLGGSDTVSGGLGTDEINFQSLDNILIVFNATTMTADYSNADGSVSGDITLTSVEQLFAGIGDGSLTDASGTDAEMNSAASGVRLAFGPEDTGYGYIAAGSSGADTITLATSTVVGSSPMTYGSLSHTVGTDILGSIIFAGAGADNITGTSSGDIIFGGADDDTITGSGGDGGDIILAGAGNDTIIVSSSDTTDGGVFIGGAGADVLQTTEIGLDTTAASFSMSGIETLESTYSVSAATITLRGSQLTGEGGDVTAVTAGFAGSTISSATGSLNVTGVSLTNIANLAGTGTTSFAVDATALGVITSYNSGATGGSITVSGANVSVNLAAVSFTNISSISGVTGSDSFTLGSAGYTMTMTDVETLVTGSGNDAITMGSVMTTGNAIDLGGGTDTLTLWGGTNVGTITNVETVNGAASTDALTLEGTVSGTTFDMGAGTDSITLADGGNSATVQNTETVDGGSGADTITTSGTANVTIFSHAGDDILNLSGSGTHSIDFDAAATNGTDTITSFNAGASGDVLDVDTLGLNGAGASTSATTAVEVLTGDAALTSGTSVVVFDDAFYTGVDSTTTFSSQVTSFLSFLGTSGTSMTGSLSAGDKLMFVIDDSTSANDISLWHWDDTSADGTIDSGEIVDVGVLDNTDISSLVAANFA